MKKVTKKENKVKTNTYNYPPDSHKEFCKRCQIIYNNGICPFTGKGYISYSCKL